MAKDPKRQLLGKIARQKGQYFEQRLDSTFDYYRERGYAEIEKFLLTPLREGRQQFSTSPS